MVRLILKCVSLCDSNNRYGLNVNYTDVPLLLGEKSDSNDMKLLVCKGNGPMQRSKVITPLPSRGSITCNTSVA